MVRAGKVITAERRAKILEISSDFKTMAEKTITDGLVALRL